MVFDEKKFLESYPQIAPPNSPSGHPGHLNSDQEKALEHLRTIVDAQGYTERTDDATLLRFLRARQFDVGRALEMYVACEKWRKEFGTNTILGDFEYPEREEVLKMYPKYYFKTDKDGRPVYYEHVGKVDYHALLKITTQERMIRELVREYEAFIIYRLPAASRECGYLQETSCTVLDLKGVGITSAKNVYPFISEAAHIGQNYYPERMGKFYIINAPWGFSAVFSVIKRFLDPATAEKIHVLNSSYKKDLLKQIPEYNLPQELGGKAESDGPIYLSNDGPWKEPKFQGPEVEAFPLGGNPPKTEDGAFKDAPEAL